MATKGEDVEYMAARMEEEQFEAHKHPVHRLFSNAVRKTQETSRVQGADALANRATGGIYCISGG